MKLDAEKIIKEAEVKDYGIEKRLIRALVAAINEASDKGLCSWDQCPVCRPPLKVGDRVVLRGKVAGVDSTSTALDVDTGTILWIPKDVKMEREP